MSLFIGPLANVGRPGQYRHRNGVGMDKGTQVAIVGTSYLHLFHKVVCGRLGH
jgi:hypothetical protein